jgi:hypothetical protein
MMFKIKTGAKLDAPFNRSITIPRHKVVPSPSNPHVTTSRVTKKLLLLGLLYLLSVVNNGFYFSFYPTVSLIEHERD